MITALTLKNIATYREECNITDLTKVNFFYGYNGTGKSTIARYINDLSLDEKERNLIYEDCKQTGYDNTQHQILVFDEKFVEKNFIERETQGGIFSLNNENEKTDSQIKEKEKILNNCRKYVDVILTNREKKVTAKYNK